MTTDSTPTSGNGTLAGLRVVELGGIGPGPHTAMMLADMGADVVTVLRPGETESSRDGWAHITRRGRRIVELNLKDDAGLAELLRLVSVADVLIEGFRPGVTERMGVGPDVCLERNPRLVYARMTGWGQDGPWAQRAGHDINYLSITGHLNAIGRAGEAPVPPLNLGADFGGGSMFCISGILAALYSRSVTGAGQVIDVAMVDGAAVLGQFQWAMRARGQWSDKRGTNMLDTGYPFYDTYACADGGYMAVGALEPQFYAEFARLLEIDGPEAPGQFDFDRWGELRELIASRFATKSRDDWAEVFDGTDACTTPVLSYTEALANEHNVARGIYTEIAGDAGPVPAPRFSGTPSPVPAAPPRETVDPAGIWT
ncbi:CaiB/BaiF CoA transferase family protein [Dietzia sp.]|uniref:CaiB/BaiF CoA transferase family protein n=1 Tax=Dietzia sp. TaxID=1871616 RepID=UPI002FD9A46E